MISKLVAGGSSHPQWAARAVCGTACWVHSSLGLRSGPEAAAEVDGPEPGGVNFSELLYVIMLFQGKQDMLQFQYPGLVLKMPI